MALDFLLSDSFLQPNLSSINSDVPLAIYCVVSRPSSFIFITFSITNIILLLPLCILILYHGIQQWWQKHSTSSAATMSHSDSLTYHMVTLALVGVFGCILCCFGIYSAHLNTLEVGLILYSFSCYGEIFFQDLTCVERYLAVVHPITYLSLRNERGISIRNISIGCVWLLSFVGLGLMVIEEMFIILNFFIVLLSVFVISFCSLSVLFILIRPGPGEQGGNRGRADQSKQREFYTMVAILGVLLLRVAYGLFGAILYVSREDANCVAMISGVWFNLPCTLVLPLLFLHRAGKSIYFKNNI